MKNRSPSGHNARPDTSIHQRGMHNRSPSAVEPKPKGGSVNAEPTRSKVGVQAPTIGPRVA
jgi:hypothetical protein